VSGRAEPYSPSAAAVGLRGKLVTNAQLFLGYLRGQRDSADDVFERLELYDQLTRARMGRALADLRILEIGFGARPWALVALLGMGADAWGVDVEVPVLDGSRREFREMYRANGLERTAKSAVRHLFFDAAERREVQAELRRRGWTRPAPRDRFVVGDATERSWPDEDFDLIVSEDVFEHIPPDGLRELVPRMTRWLKPDGLALVCPNVFTGITGGHHLDWSRFSFSRPPPRRRTPPWDHLRARSAAANTYLNELSRADYRELLEARFEILEEIVRRPDLGREFLTGEAAVDLSRWAEEELFSNQVLFVLRPAAPRSGSALRRFQTEA
jgi:Methyltransferase domain